MGLSPHPSYLPYVVHACVLIQYGREAPRPPLRRRKEGAAHHEVPFTSAGGGHKKEAEEEEGGGGMARVGAQLGRTRGGTRPPARSARPPARARRVVDMVMRFCGIPKAVWVANTGPASRPAARAARLGRSSLAGRTWPGRLGLAAL